MQYITWKQIIFYLFTPLAFILVVPASRLLLSTCINASLSLSLHYACSNSDYARLRSWLAHSNLRSIFALNRSGRQHAIRTHDRRGPSTAKTVSYWSEWNSWRRCERLLSQDSTHTSSRQSTTNERRNE